mmetsp:Transcript_8610/g.20725  ORF Transcript_8610/g.20725 Transcript_8610/m.20725 type:complete len:222 (+) Transcript_8610:242-907(+)
MAKQFHPKRALHPNLREEARAGGVAVPVRAALRRARGMCCRAVRAGCPGSRDVRHQARGQWRGLSLLRRLLPLLLLRWLLLLLLCRLLGALVAFAHDGLDHPRAHGAKQTTTSAATAARRGGLGVGSRLCRVRAARLRCVRAAAHAACLSCRAFRRAVAAAILPGSAAILYGRGRGCGSGRSARWVPKLNNGTTAAVHNVLLDDRRRARWQLLRLRLHLWL